MLKHKSPKDFYKKARENSCENNGDIVTREEVKKELQARILKR